MNVQHEYEKRLAELEAAGMDRVAAIRHIAITEPALNAARNEAYTQRHRAARVEHEDPIAHERAEAARLVQVVRERYSGPGLATRFLGTEKPEVDRLRYMPGVGYFEGFTIPREIAMVSGLHVLIGRIDAAETVAYAIDAAKKLAYMVRAAQSACGEVPAPLALSAMTPAQQTISMVLYRMDATNPLRATKRGQIAERMELHPDTVKDSLRALRALRIVRTVGSGAGMTYYLTPEGVAVGSYLHEHG